MPFLVVFYMGSMDHETVKLLCEFIIFPRPQPSSLNRPPFRLLTSLSASKGNSHVSFDKVRRLTERPSLFGQPEARCAFASVRRAV